MAARLALGLTGDCIDLDVNDRGQLLQYKPAFGGNIVAPILSKTTPEMATVRPGMLKKAKARPARQARIELLQPDGQPPAGFGWYRKRARMRAKPPSWIRPRLRLESAKAFRGRTTCR